MRGDVKAWDDARLVVQIGGDAVNAMEVAREHAIYVVNGSKCRLALLADREKYLESARQAGSPSYIDALQSSMLLWKEEKRGELVRYLAERDLLEDGPFWKLANALLGERHTLRAEGKVTAFRDDQRQLFEES